MLKKAGFNVDDQAMDWGTVVQRRAMQTNPDAGGWNAFSTFWAGLDQSNPVGHAFLRGNGKQALFGWPTAPKLEELRAQWIDAPDLHEPQEDRRGVAAAGVAGRALRAARAVFRRDGA